MHPARRTLGLLASSATMFLFAGTALAASCDPAGLDACVEWAEQQVADAGCHVDDATFREAISDLYLNKGCRLEGTRWYDLATGATVQGGVENGRNVDSAGCIARYTPGAHLAKGGYFRTPKEALNGPLRNASLSGCEKQDPGAITGPIVSGVMSCSCAPASAAPKPDVKSVGPSGEKEAEPPKECGKGEAEDPDTGKCRELVACPKEKHLTRKTPFECGCESLHDFLDEEKKECVFFVEKDFHFDDDTRDKFQDAVQGLDKNGHVFFEGSLENGKPVKVGILRLADGSVVFTPDGEHYYEDPADAIVPSFWTRVGKTWDGVKKGFLRFFGVGKYTAKGTAGEDGEVSQDEGQRRLDASDLTLKNLKNEAKDPEELKSEAEEIVERWGNRVKNPVTGEYDAQLLEEIKNATGVDVPMIKKVLTKDLEGIGEDVLKKLYAFPVDAVITLSKELKSASFGNAARLYITERENGSTPAQIRGKVANNDLTELDFVTSVSGVGQQYAQEALFIAYEEAYQRYLLKKEMGR